MKKLILMLTVMVSYTFTNAQNIIDKHFSHYKGADNFTTISVTGKMFQLASQIEMEIDGKDTEHMQDMISRIESFNMIVGEEMPNAKADYTNGLLKVKDSHEELMRINNKEGNFTIKIDESNGLVKEVIMIAQSDKNFVAFSLMGSIQMEELGEVVNEIQKHGMDDIEQIFDNNNIDDFKVYPNPSKSSQNVNIDIPNKMIGGKVIVTDLDGKLLDQYEITNQTQSINTNNYRNGSYIVQLVKDDIRMSKKVIILD